MKRSQVFCASIVLLCLLLGACGGSTEGPKPSDNTIGQEDSAEDALLKIVGATCSDLRNASSQAEAAQTLSYAIQLAESIGVTSEQLGSFLSSACQDALNDANQLP